MRTSSRFVTAAFCAGLLTAVAASAIGQARVRGKVLDEKGAPVAGAKITATSAVLGNISFTATSDGKGSYTLLLGDASKPYQWRVEKEGFETYDQEIKIPIGSNIERNFTLVAAVTSTGQEVSGAIKAVETYNAGVLALRGGDRAGAAEKFREALAIDPTVAAAQVALAGIALEEKKYDEALALAGKALELDAKSVLAWNTVYLAAAALGNEARVSEAAGKLAELDPKSAAIHLFNRSLDLYQDGKVDRAIAALEQALGLDASNIEIEFQLGLCYSSLSQNAKALEHLQKFLAAAPADHPERATAEEMLKYLK